MDNNKLKKLREIKYAILRCCGMCEHGKWNQVRTPNGPWGTCALHTYEHLKHSGPPRQMSIHQFGSCDDWTQASDHNIGAWEEFRS